MGVRTVAREEGFQVIRGGIVGGDLSADLRKNSISLPKRAVTKAEPGTRVVQTEGSETGSMTLVISKTEV